jgi:hypothetical protein
MRAAVRRRWRTFPVKRRMRLCLGRTSAATLRSGFMSSCHTRARIISSTTRSPVRLMCTLMFTPLPFDRTIRMRCCTPPKRCLCPLSDLLASSRQGSCTTLRSQGERRCTPIILSASADDLPGWVAHYTVHSLHVTCKRSPWWIGSGRSGLVRWIMNHRHFLHC